MRLRLRGNAVNGMYKRELEEMLMNSTEYSTAHSMRRLWMKTLGAENRKPRCMENCVGKMGQRTMMQNSGGMDRLTDPAEEWTGAEKETRRGREDVATEQRDRLSNGLQCNKESVSQEELCTSMLHKTQHVAFEENQSSKPSLSFIALIAKAILSSASRKLSLSSIYRYIEEHFPYFKTTHRGWRNSIRHNLSLNDCFVKLGRCEDGKGHYWGIHPAHLADFLRGDFRQHRKANRSRHLRACHGLAEACSWMAQCCSLEYWGSGAATGEWIQDH
ncbi:hypothetical protein NFI96_002961 [Prochilodus magdalenae]|nr:hypothetical protein NFI96_002961 [Prochilodus magdalenae]